VTQKQTEILMDTIITRDVSIPRLGFGMFRMPDGGYEPVVESALALGHRHLDTAAMYENQDAVGVAIAALPKDQRCVTPPFAPDWNAPTL